jgi:predicted phosphoribosyltransferase
MKSCVWSHRAIFVVGIHYADFTQTSDDEVIEMLAKQRADAPGASAVH